jgi:MoaA/NifB/PqqE/SkfB family radical SAM enzyme
MTLTRENYPYLTDVIRRMTDKNIWTFFDIIHPDRGQPGSKVKDTNIDLLFAKEDYAPLLAVLDRVLELKKEGYLCHASESFIGMLRRKIPLYKPYSWNCAEERIFPSWVTVDCDGIVKPCDDFYKENVVEIPVWELKDRWEEFGATWRPVVGQNCPGCLWNTHIDSHRIKEGKIPMTNYIHGTSPEDFKRAYENKWEGI